MTKQTKLLKDIVYNRFNEKNPTIGYFIREKM